MFKGPLLIALIFIISVALFRSCALMYSPPPPPPVRVKMANDNQVAAEKEARAFTQEQQNKLDAALGDHKK